MITQTPNDNSVLLFKGGPTLMNLLVDHNEMRIIITGPGMLFDRLELLTTLSAFDGYTVARLRELAANLEGTIHCGLVGVIHAEIDVKTVRSGGVLEIGLGPSSMYQSSLVLRTKTSETFSSLIYRVLSPAQSHTFFIGLHAVTAVGHLEHHHGSNQQGHNTHNHSNHEGGHHGHS